MMKLSRLSVFFCVSLLSLTSLSAFAETRQFFVEALEKNKTKFWIPTKASMKEGAAFSEKEGVKFTVKKGDTVVFHLVSKIKGANNIHGFAIDEYKVEALVDDKGLFKSKDKEINFVADKPGTFKIRCHLHPAHVGGELIVSE